MCCRWLLQAIPDLFLLEGIGDLSCCPEEIKVSSYSASMGSTLSAPTKGVVVEIVAGLLELVAEAVIGVFEVKATN